MKIISFILIVVLIIIGSSNSMNQENNIKHDIIDENSFKQDLQESVLEFVGDLGLDPDSVYIPFK